MHRTMSESRRIKGLDANYMLVQLPKDYVVQ